MRIARATLVAILLAGCAGSPVEIHGSQGQALSLAVGQDLAVTLGNVGPGEYGAPSMSSGVLHYLGVSIVGPNLPSGPTQQFRFRAVAAGRAILSFKSSGSGPLVVDTVNVY